MIEVYNYNYGNSVGFDGFIIVEILLLYRLSFRSVID